MSDMKEPNPDDYRKGLDYANWLAQENVVRAPTVAAERFVREAVRKIQNLYATSRRTKQSQIASFMVQNSGTCSVPELVAKFKWPRQLAHSLLSEMVKAGIVIKYQSQAIGSGARGGRPATRYRLKS